MAVLRCRTKSSISGCSKLVPKVESTLSCGRGGCQHPSHGNHQLPWNGKHGQGTPAGARPPMETLLWSMSMSPERGNGWWQVLLLAVMPSSSHPTGAEHQMCTAVLFAGLEPRPQSWQPHPQGCHTPLGLAPSSMGLAPSFRVGPFLQSWHPEVFTSSARHPQIEVQR